jgi:hypothetical protein
MSQIIWKEKNKKTIKEEYQQETKYIFNIKLWRKRNFIRDAINTQRII